MSHHANVLTGSSAGYRVVAAYPQSLSKAFIARRVEADNAAALF
jgi:hypothetical protein